MSEDTIEIRLERAQAAEPKRKLFVADSPAGVLILGTPSRANYLLYRQYIQGDDATDKAKAPDVLFQACMVDPPVAEAQRIFEECPAIAGCPEVAAAVAKACGLVKSDIAKK